ncbi:GntR family transcriptional regulator [Chloroflexi bacterium TSY]|nr:GntR family transcriptional regulator [Chloroflexi bacterium TSY]
MVPTSILAVSSRRRNGEESLGDLAYQRIKEKIVSLDLPPASLIDEAMISDEIGIGLTPIRQALRRLASERLVVILPRRGTLVADLNLSDLHKIFEMRIELETLAARLAAQRANQEQVDALWVITKQGLVFAGTGDNRQLIEIDRQIHLTIAQSAQNEFLEETIEWLYNHVQRLWNLSIDRVDGLEQAMSEHQRMIGAIQNKDGERAAQLMREHVGHFQRRFKDIL